MKPYRLFTSLLLLAFLPVAPARADLLTIPNLSTTTSVEQLSLPTRGATMDEVSAQFGQPRDIKAPVGNPPITRWVYDKFTVHFEQDRVIHSVIHRK